MLISTEGRSPTLSRRPHCQKQPFIGSNMTWACKGYRERSIMPGRPAFGRKPKRANNDRRKYSILASGSTTGHASSSSCSETA